MDDSIITAPPAAVSGARGLLWLSEVARDLGVEVTGMKWHPTTGHLIVVADRAAVAAVAARLGLTTRTCGCHSHGEWADMTIAVEAAS